MASQHSNSYAIHAIPSLPSELWEMVFRDFGASDLCRLVKRKESAESSIPISNAITTLAKLLKPSTVSTVSNLPFRKYFCPTDYDKYIAVKNNLDLSTVEGVLQLHLLKKCAVCGFKDGVWGLCDTCYSIRRYNSNNGPIDVDDEYFSDFDLKINDTTEPYVFYKGHHCSSSSLNGYNIGGDYEVEIMTEWGYSGNGNEVETRFIEINHDYCVCLFWYTTEFPDEIIQVFADQGSYIQDELLAKHWRGKLPKIVELSEITRLYSS